MAKDLSKLASGRPRRTPLNVRNKLNIPNREEGYHYRIVNVKEDRVQQFMEQGYEIVPNTKVGDKQVDSPSSLGNASEISVGQGMKAVVMRTPIEYFREDQAIKQAQIDELEATMKSKAKEGT